MKYMAEFHNTFGTREVFRIQDVEVFLRARRAPLAYAHTLIHRLRRKGDLRRVTRGVYTFRPEGEVVGFAFSPFYYGLQDALSIRNLWEQETNSLIITPRNVRGGVRTLGGARVIVHRISRRAFFGYDLVKTGASLYLPVSDIEKTLIDFFYFREPLSAKLLRSLYRRCRPAILRAYLRRMPVRTRLAVARAINDRAAHRKDLIEWVQTGTMDMDLKDLKKMRRHRGAHAR